MFFYRPDNAKSRKQKETRTSKSTSWQGKRSESRPDPTTFQKSTRSDPTTFQKSTFDHALNFDSPYVSRNGPQRPRNSYQTLSENRFQAFEERDKFENSESPDFDTLELRLERLNEKLDSVSAKTSSMIRRSHELQSHSKILSVEVSSLQKDVQAINYAIAD
jgi:hypothetical protein